MDRSRLYESFAQIFEYPNPDLVSHAKESAILLSDYYHGAATMMNHFVAYAEKHSLGHLQEVYTRTFDLQPSCFPYVGYQLFGESYKRGDFLARLKGRYTQNGFDTGKELPDHISLVLRFLARIEDGDEAKEMVEFCLAPSLEKMIGSLANKRNPYVWVLNSLAESIKTSRANLVSES